MSDIVVFISYRRESQAHIDKVVGLSERLRKDGITTILDEYEKRGVPAEGWTRWMANNLSDASHVICVCTEAYSAHVMGRGGGSRPSGVDWEGSIIANELYACNNRTDKFVLVAFSNQDAAHVPTLLISRTCHVLDSEANYRRLYDSLMAQAGVEPGEVGRPNHKRRRVVNPLEFPDVHAAPSDVPPSAAAGRAPPAEVPLGLSSTRKLLVPIVATVGVLTAAAWVLGQQYLEAAPSKAAALPGSGHVPGANVETPSLDPAPAQRKTGPDSPTSSPQRPAAPESTRTAKPRAPETNTAAQRADRYLESYVQGPADKNVAVHLLPLKGQDLGSLTGKVREALRTKGYRAIKLFKEPFTAEGLDQQMFEGSVAMLEELEIAKYCERMVVGNVRLPRAATSVEGVFIAEAVLTLRGIGARTGEQIEPLEVSEKGSGETAEDSIADALRNLETTVTERIGEWSW